MKICHIITALGFGGAERLLVNFSNQQSQHHEVHIIYLKDEVKLASFLNKSIQLHHAPLDWKCASAIRNILLKIKPDVVHTHLGHADLIGFWASRNLKLKLICTIHNVYYKYNWKDTVFFKAYKLAFKTYASHCYVSCVSDSIAKHVIHTLGVKPSKVKVIYNAIPSLELLHPKEYFREQLHLPPDTFAFLFLGRLSLQKSIPTLIHAVNRLKDKMDNFVVLIVGEGQLNNDLQELSIKLKLNKWIRFEGPTYSPENYLHACDSLVLPSVFEGLPTVVLEAFRAKLAVIASNIPGTNELVTNMETGLLFPSGDDGKLAELMFKMATESHVRSDFTKNAYDYWEKNFSIQNYTKQTEELYESAIAGKKLF